MMLSPTTPCGSASTAAAVRARRRPASALARVALPMPRRSSTRAGRTARSARPPPSSTDGAAAEDARRSAELRPRMLLATPAPPPPALLAGAARAAGLARGARADRVAQLDQAIEFARLPPELGGAGDAAFWR